MGLGWTISLFQDRIPCGKANERFFALTVDECTPV